MASPLPALDPRTTSKRIQYGLSLPSDFDTQSKYLDNTSPTSQVSSPAHQKPRCVTTQSSPTPLQRNTAKRPRATQPPTTHKRRSRLSEEFRSVSDGTLTTGAEFPIYSSIQTPEAQKEGVTSLCGKYYKTPGGLMRHEKTCAVCIETAGQKRTEETFETTLDTKRKDSSESRQPNPFLAVCDHPEAMGASTSQSNGETPERLRLHHDRAVSIHEHDSTQPNTGVRTPTHEESPGDSVLNNSNKTSNRRTSRGTDREPPIATGAEDPEIISAEALGLEDGPNPDGAFHTFTGRSLNAVTLHAKIRESLERGLTKYDQQGYIYVFADPNQPHLHKIGRSINTSRRKQQLEYKCGLNLQCIERKEVNNYFRTELLIHAYLLDLRGKYECSVCGTNHGEWFEIDAISAKAAVAQWTKFMNEETPYDSVTRQLQPFITDLFRSRDNLLSTTDKNFETVREHWKRNLTPTFLDHYQLKYSGVWGLLWKFYWPLNTMFAWTVAFVVSHHPAAFFFMAASVIGTFISISGENHRLQRLSMGPKRKSK